MMSSGKMLSVTVAFYNRRYYGDIKTVAPYNCWRRTGLALGELMTDHIHRHRELAGDPVGVAGRLLGPLTRGAKRAHESMFGLARHADWYDSVPGRLAHPLYRRVAADVAAAGLQDGAFVLDVGTGPGRVPLLIAERCPSLLVEGIDLSERMIARAARSPTGAE